MVPYSPRGDPLVSIVTWFLLVVSAFAVLGRLLTKWAVAHRVNSDDALVLLSLAFSIGSGIAVSVQAANGLAITVQSVSSDQLERFLKGSYASYMLYIATLCTAKGSIVLFLRSLSPSHFHKRLGLGLGTFILVWGVTSIIATAFQCATPATWNVLENSCFNRSAFWHVLGGVNILTDLALILLPFYIISTLQMSSSKKAIILVCFAARVIDIIATSAQLVFTSAFNSSNVTRDIWQWTLIAQVIQCVTIITSCIPYLKPLLESYPSGMYISDEIRRRGLNGSYGISSGRSESYPLKDRPKPSTDLARFKRSTDLTMTTQSLIGPRHMQAETVVSVAAPVDQRLQDILLQNTQRPAGQLHIVKTTTMMLS